MIYWQLFLEFFQTGLFAIGGGLATLPFLYKIADKYQWFTYSKLADMIAISETTPGPIGINMATYAGITAGGIWGGIVATLSIVLPSLIIVMLIANFMERFQKNEKVQRAFAVIRPVVTGLIAAAVLEIFKIALFSFDEMQSGFWHIFKWREWALFAFLIFLMFKYKIHPIFYILLGATIGMIFGLA